MPTVITINQPLHLNKAKKETLTWKKIRLFVTRTENKTHKEKMLYRCYEAVEVMKNNMSDQKLNPKKVEKHVE